MPKKIEKSFPADTSMIKDEKGNLIKTFLNDPKADAELYAYLLSMSRGIEGETRVYKDSLPIQSVIATEILHYKSRRTVINHLNYLKEQKYIIDQDKYYLLPNKEKMYFKIPQDLLSFFIDTVKEPIIKTYIYLGQRNNYKPNQYVFTLKEICEHLGLYYQKNSEIIKNYLFILEQLELIKIVKFYEGKTPKMRLINFSTELPKRKNYLNN